MTATVAPPRGTAPTPPPRSADRRPPGRQAATDHTLASDVSATVPLALFSLAVAAGFARVFSGWQFFDNLFVIVVVGHGVGLALRRLRLPGLIAVPALAFVLLWLVGFIHYRSTYSFLLPNSETYQLFTDELQRIGEQFATAVAPVIYGGGWDVLASIGVALAVLLADTFAFRAYGRAEALVPGGVLFVFVAALGADRDRVALSVALVAAGVLATAMLRAYHATVRRSTIGGVRSAASLAFPGAIVAAIVIAAAAGYIGPRLPGAGAEAIYDATEGGSDVTTVVNPLVDIRSRLTNQSDTELFTMEASAESYWRTAALPEFDGRRWVIPDERLEAPDDGTLQPRSTSVEITQTVRVSNLGGNSIPAAPDVRFAAGGPGVDVERTPVTELLVKTDGDLVSGETFNIVSASPRFSAAELAGATSTNPPDPIYLELPDDFPAVAASTAEQVTAPATSPFQAAVLLQDWFREFDYSTEVQRGHSTNDIEAFLRDRVGYCEQFAGTYAAMMRSLGYPARVAVGFTSGEQVQPGVFTVRGKNAHAWPEVWFDGLGWVKFEPTPTRGAPDAEYTGVDPAQDDTPVAEQPAAGDAAATPAPTTVAPGADPRLNPDDLQGLFPEIDNATGAPPAEEPGGVSVLPWLLALAVIALAVALPALSRWYWRRMAGDGDDHLRLLWNRSVRALADVGVHVSPTQTPHEVAAVAGREFPISSRPIEGLADVVTESTYRPIGSVDLDHDGGYGRTTIRECGAWTRQIERATRDSTPAWQRVVHHFTRWR